MQSKEQHAVSHRRCSQPDQVAAGLGAAFQNVRDLDFKRHGFHYEQTIISLGDLRLVRYQNSGVSFSAIQGTSFHIGFVIRGSVAVRSRGHDVSTRPFVAGNTIGSLEQFSVNVSPETITHTLDLPHELLTRQAEALFGKRVDTTPSACAVDLRSDAGCALVRNARSVFSEALWFESTRLSGLAVASFTELLANLILATTFPRLCSEQDSEVADPGQNATKRARQFLDDFAHEPVRISQLAEVTGVSVRSLQQRFQKEFGCSPLQYLIARRLELAHERLSSPMRADTVTSVAAECGFMNLGKFASRYRIRYGVLPSETLKKSRVALWA